MKVIRESFLARRAYRNLQCSHTTKKYILKILNLEQNVDCRSSIKII